MKLDDAKAAGYDVSAWGPDFKGVWDRATIDATIHELVPVGTFVTPDMEYLCKQTEEWLNLAQKGGYTAANVNKDLTPVRQPKKPKEAPKEMGKEVAMNVPQSAALGAGVALGLGGFLFVSLLGSMAKALPTAKKEKVQIPAGKSERFEKIKVKQREKVKAAPKATPKTAEPKATEPKAAKTPAPMWGTGKPPLN